MINPEQAEELATKHMQDYVNACGCRDVEDVGNVLMKLVSVCGLAMIATQGQDVAVARLEGTAQHLAKPQFRGKWKSGPVQ